MGDIFENVEFLNVAKFPTLARLIIRYSIRELLQNVNVKCNFHVTNYTKTFFEL